MAIYTICLTDKGEDLPNAEKSDEESGRHVLKWPSGEAVPQPYGMERRSELGTKLVVPWHRIAYVRLGN